MNEWHSRIDEAIRKAMADGQFANLPGQGKPLKLDDNPYTPGEQRLAYKILKDNDLAPDWMMLGRTLEEKRKRLLERLQGAARAYRLSRRGSELEQARGDETWRRVRSHLAVEAEKLNREIATYNLQAPTGVARKLHFDLERETTRVLDGL
jgi:hypothetical protein